MKLLNEASKLSDSAEVFAIESRTVPVKFESGELESVKSVETSGAALRVIRDGRLGFSSTTNLEDPGRTVEKAAETAKFGDEAGFDFPESSSVPDVPTFYPGVSELTASDLIDYGQEVIGRIEEFDPDLELNLDVNRSVDEVRVLNSNGLEVEEKRTSISISLEVKDVGEDDIFSFRESELARDLEGFDPEGLIERALRKLEWSRSEAAIGSGSFPVVFTPRGTLVLLFPLLAGFNGKNAFQGTSPLEGRRDERVFSEAFSLIDDGLAEDSPARRGFDDEGLPVERTPLAEEGKVKNFLYDLQTAGLADRKPTGNGLKGGLLGGGDFRTPPSTGPTSLLVGTGERSVDELISEVDAGLLVDQVLGLGQGNALSGEFSNNVSVAYKIEGGEVTARVKNTMIAGNVYDLLDGDIEMGGEAEWIGGGLKAPAAVLSGVNVVQKG